MTNVHHNAKPSYTLYSIYTDENFSKNTIWNLTIPYYLQNVV